MTLQQLRYVCEVVRQGMNITRAAAALNVSQPALSKQLQLVESELGTPLFERRARRLTGLTEPGRHIVDTARRMLQLGEQMFDIAREFAAGGEGAFTVATTHTQARYALPGVIKRFVARYPNVRLHLRQGTPKEVLRLVGAGEADIAIAAEAPEAIGGVVQLPCYELRRIVLVPAGHPLLAVKRIALRDVARHPLITYDDAFIGRSRLMHAFAARGLVPNVVLSAIDADVIKTYVENRLGIAILPELAYDRARDRALRAIPAHHLFAANTIQCSIRAGSFLRGYMYDFIEMFAPRLDRRTVELALQPAP